MAKSLSTKVDENHKYMFKIFDRKENKQFFLG